MPRGIPAPEGGRREDAPKTYDSWRAARRRCTDRTHKDFVRYGAIGVTVCDEWATSFLAFRKGHG